MLEYNFNVLPNVNMLILVTAANYLHQYALEEKSEISILAYSTVLRLADALISKANDLLIKNFDNSIHYDDNLKLEVHSLKKVLENLKNINSKEINNWIKTKANAHYDLIIKLIEK